MAEVYVHMTSVDALGLRAFRGLERYEIWLLPAAGDTPWDTSKRLVRWAEITYNARSGEPVRTGYRSKNKDGVPLENFQ